MAVSRYVPTPWDAEVLGRTIYGEARGEPALGRSMVGWVFVNRTNDPARRWPVTIAAACLQPKQASCWNSGDANRGRLMAVCLTEPAFLECYAMAWAVLGGLTKDPGKGANHYLTVDLARSSPPEWFDDDKVTATIGHHVCLRL